MSRNSFDVWDRIMKRRSDRGLAERDKDAREMYDATKDSRKAMAAYCEGNRWLEENAKANEASR